MRHAQRHFVADSASLLLSWGQRQAIAALPADLASGLALLRRQSAAPVTRLDVWATTVIDATMLAADGWATQALALGWHPLELFGCAVDAMGDNDRLGLAASLSGRRVLSITADHADMSNGRLRWRVGRPGLLGADMHYLWSYDR